MHIKNLVVGQKVKIAPIDQTGDERRVAQPDDIREATVTELGENYVIVEAPLPEKYKDNFGIVSYRDAAARIVFHRDTGRQTRWGQDYGLPDDKIPWSEPGDWRPLAARDGALWELLTDKRLDGVLGADVS